MQLSDENTMTDGEKLEIGGLQATELAENFDTPLYVYDVKR